MKRLIFSILICFFLHSPAFAIDCSLYDFAVAYYSKQEAARQAALDYTEYSLLYHGTSYVNSIADVCFGIEPGLSFYQKYGNVAGILHGKCFVYDTTCADSDSDGLCDSSEDSDGDGIPDGQDPCPDNPRPDCSSPDSDGDGIPDDEDPCPQNPNPNCTDPDYPPPETPEIPDEIIVGDCTFDLTSFKEWLNTDSSFPFNLMFRFVALITPLFDLTPAPPVFDISIDASAISGRFSYIPSTISFSWDFTEYDIYAKILRAVEILSIVIAVVSYGLNSNKERP